MVNYLTLIICCVSCIILGGTATATWLIFREKDIVEQLKARLGTNRNRLLTDELKAKFNMSGVTSGRSSTAARPESNAYTGKCPVENCNITRPHSHAEALIRRVKEK